MPLFNQPSDTALQLIAQRSTLGSQLRNALTEHLTYSQVEPGICLNQHFEGFTNTLFFITGGIVRVEHRDKGLMELSEGCIIGLERCEGSLEASFYTSSNLSIGQMNAALFWQCLQSSAELNRIAFQYFAVSQALLMEQLSAQTANPYLPQTGYTRITAGDIIIHEGDLADQVFTLVEGTAAAYRNGVKLGEIGTNEVFGAIAVFTAQRRTATVVALTDCILLAIPKSDFLELIAQQPQVCTGLLAEMASRISQLNHQVIDLNETLRDKSTSI